mmetsp:Transcript_11301/g.17483  ORF Transcript_11301/g.17483 Transcript_11301/m.17483 type:complete len:339 (+) Transcript_11301:274-1290(+)
MDCTILYNVPPTYSDRENRYLQEPNNKSNHDEDLIELSIEEICQSWKDGPDGRDVLVSSTAFQDPLDEVATSLNKMQDDNYPSVIPKNFTHADIFGGNSQYFPDTLKIGEEDAIDPIQEVSEVDLETIVDLLLKEEKSDPDLPDYEPQLTSESKTDKEVKAQVDLGVTEEKKEDSSLLTKVPNSGHWSAHEHKLFRIGIERYGRQWRAISNMIKTRTPTQVRTHAQKHFSKDPDLRDRSMRQGTTEERPLKRQRFDTCEVVSNANTTSKEDWNDDFSGIRHGRWLRKEHELFLEGHRKFGRDWNMVASVVKTRTVLQIRTHAQKYFQKLSKSAETTTT